LGASELIARLALAGVKLSADGDRLIADVQPGSALTDELRLLIRENKAPLLTALAPATRGVELRRQRVLAKLAAEPDRQRAAIFDPDAERGMVICTIAVRGVGTCELRIPSDRFDAWAVLEAMQRTQ
jgi:hypothetical protein